MWVSLGCLGSRGYLFPLGRRKDRGLDFAGFVLGGCCQLLYPRMRQFFCGIRLGLPYLSNPA